ncbi:hypothetical protein C8R44DRAFT_873631 [Mycena epipterygia]|nr:hypothetical protein C8R44DRAFT_873631 [Mycena epipterygia]
MKMDDEVDDEHEVACALVRGSARRLRTRQVWNTLVVIAPTDFVRLRSSKHSCSRVTRNEKVCTLPLYASRAIASYGGLLSRSLYFVFGVSSRHILPIFASCVWLRVPSVASESRSYEYDGVTLRSLPVLRAPSLPCAFFLFIDGTALAVAHASIVWHPTTVLRWSGWRLWDVNVLPTLCVALGWVSGACACAYVRGAGGECVFAAAVGGGWTQSQSWHGGGSMSGQRRQTRTQVSWASAVRAVHPMRVTGVGDVHAACSCGLRCDGRARVCAGRDVSSRQLPAASCPLDGAVVVAGIAILRHGRPGPAEDADAARLQICRYGGGAVCVPGAPPLRAHSLYGCSPACSVLGAAVVRSDTVLLSTIHSSAHPPAAANLSLSANPFIHTI